VQILSDDASPIGSAPRDLSASSRPLPPEILRRVGRKGDAAASTLLCFREEEKQIPQFQPTKRGRRARDIALGSGLNPVAPTGSMRVDCCDRIKVPR
jgi:hypothetical protein